jgi:cobalt/nickel transport system permease protein
MHLIDQYAYSNRIRSVDPAARAGLALLMLVLCLLLNRIAVGVLTIGWMGVLTTWWAGVSGRVFVRLILAEGGFLVLAVVGVAVSVGFTPPPPHAWQWSIGPLWVSSTPAAAGESLLLLSRALGSAAAMNFLTLTTPLVDLIELLRRLRVPPLLVDLMTLMYRFIFILLESMQTMYTAQQSRQGYSTVWRSMKSAALLGSRLFIDAYQRSQRMQVALESRCADGTLRVLPIAYRHDWRVLWIGAAIVASMLLVWRLW